MPAKGCSYPGTGLLRLSFGPAGSAFSGKYQKKRSLPVKRKDAAALSQGNYTPLLAYGDSFAAECYCLAGRLLSLPNISNNSSFISLSSLGPKTGNLPYGFTPPLQHMFLQSCHVPGHGRGFVYCQVPDGSEGCKGHGLYFLDDCHRHLLRGRGLSGGGGRKHTEEKGPPPTWPLP